MTNDRNDHRGNDADGAPPIRPEIAADRRRLAELIGRLLARHRPVTRPAEMTDAHDNEGSEP
jgi:hypothetical protein